MERWTIAQIKDRHNRLTEGHFFDAPTMRFFHNRMTDFRVRHIDGKVYVINTNGGSVYLFHPDTGELDYLADDAIPAQIDRTQLQEYSDSRLRRTSYEHRY